MRQPSPELKKLITEAFSAWSQEVGAPDPQKHEVKFGTLAWRQFSEEDYAEPGRGIGMEALGNPGLAMSAAMDLPVMAVGVTQKRQSAIRRRHIEALPRVTDQVYVDGDHYIGMSGKALRYTVHHEPETGRIFNLAVEQSFYRATPIPSDEHEMVSVGPWTRLAG